MDKEFLEGLGVSLPEEAVDAILQKAEQENRAWQEKYDQMVSAHTRAREEMMLEQAITVCGGRNVKAISALLDTKEIFGSEDAENALHLALDKLKTDCAYLFESPAIPPFSRMAGSAQQALPQPVTLAGALRARMKKG